MVVLYICNEVYAIAGITSASIFYTGVNLQKKGDYSYSPYGCVIQSPIVERNQSDEDSEHRVQFISCQKLMNAYGMLLSRKENDSPFESSF